jgi:membrane protein implicated in regulation of membrane protease activity
MEWWVWLAGGLLLMVIELATPSGFFVMFFGLGALTVGVLKRLGIVGPLWMEWLLFTVTSVAYLLLFRDRLQRRVEQPGSANVDTLVGELAVPKERILPGAVGRIELRGTSWNARNCGSEPIEPGRRCRVISIDGLLLSVQPE